MLKNYELLYIVHPDLEGTTDKVTEKVSGFIAKIDGKIVSQEDWGKRKLAYSVSHNDFGVYVLVEFEVESEKLHELERNLRLSEEIMRSMIVSLPVESEVARKPKKKKVETEKSETKVEKAVESKAEKAEEEPEKETEKLKEKATAKTSAKKTEVKSKANESPDDSSMSKSEQAVGIPTASVGKVKPEEDEKDRLKKLDEKLEEILGEDKK